ncbi:MAG: helix-turn-helix domain-containing protein, partial [Prevotella sp.]|nr:helix-turn-helix domain-containing protein [Prevotella sp.]
MKINNDFLRQSADTVEGITQLLSRFDDKREGLTWIYLLSLADDEWKVKSSINAMALQLNMHRQTLARLINRLCEKGYAAWEITPGMRRPNLLRLTACVTEGVTGSVTEDVTQKAHSDDAVTPIEPKGCENPEKPSVTAAVTEMVTNKKETKQKKEENPPALPKEEIKQKKEKTTHTNAHACEKKQTENLEERRLQFLASLTPYHERYGQEMVTQFGDYWTEPNHSLTKMRFELQRTWSTKLRLATWARNDKTFIHHHNNHD